MFKLLLSIIVLSAALVAKGNQSAYLLGDESGWRKNAIESGYDFSVTYKGEASQTFKGGNSHGTNYIDNLDLKLLVDVEKTAGLKGSSFFIYGLGNQNASNTYSPGKNTGNLLGVSNIETSNNAFKVYELYWQQNFFEDSLSFLLGLHDLNSEFYVTDSSALFFNPVFGIGIDLAQTGVNGPSIFPSTALAFRVKVQASEKIYVQTAAFNAQAGDPAAPQSNLVIRGSSNDGFLVITEAGYTQNQDLTAKYAVGAWTYTLPTDHLTDTEVNANNDVVSVTAVNQGVYVLVDQKISTELSFFVRYGFANAQVNDVESNLALGLVKEGPFAGRKDDRVGLAYTTARASSPYIQTLEASGISTSTAEEIFELNYRASIGRGIFLQPSYQKIIHPSMDSSLPDAEYGALRLEIAF